MYNIQHIMIIKVRDFENEIYIKMIDKRNLLVLKTKRVIKDACLQLFSFHTM